MSRRPAVGSVTVVGAGAVGLATALELARTGFVVEVVGGDEASASGAAAGMLAPASETLLDDLDAGFTAALRHARRRWDAWAVRLGLRLDTGGALHVGPAAELDARKAHARRLGLEAERRADGLWLPQDAVLSPAAALAALRSALTSAGAVVRPGRATAADGVLHVDGLRLQGEVVIAAGWGSAALAEAAPELAALAPIKGQLLRFAGAPGGGPTLRAPDAYLAPAPDGWTVGATMEAGRTDLEPDATALARLRAAAAAIRPELARAEARAEVGVRAAAPDGRPLVGRSRSGAWLATGMRRNGWLLAPLVAEGVAAYLAGSDADAALAGQARAWDPARVLSQGAT